VKILVARGAREREIAVEPSGTGYEVTMDGRRMRVEGRVGASMRVLLDHRPIEATVRREGAEVIVEFGGRAYTFRTRDARAPKLARRERGEDLTRGELHAPMPGLVVEVLAEMGERVEAGQTLVIVEAMKMQNAFTAPLAGKITRIAVKPGMPVETGQLLVTVTPGAAVTPGSPAVTPGTS
jgi:biotin carboxyl carrier protein